MNFFYGGLCAKLCGVLIFSCFITAGYGNDTNQVNAVGHGRAGFINRMGRTADGKVSLLGKDRAVSKPESEGKEQSQKEVELMAGLKDDDVFVQIGNEDKLTWGTLHNQVDIIFKTKIANLLAAAHGGADDLRLSLYKQGVSKLLQLYVKTAVMAYAAKQDGLVVSDAEIKAEVSNMLKKGPATLFQYQMVTNSLYQKAYIDKYIKPRIKVSGEAVEELIKKRHETNLMVPLTNALIKAQIDDIRLRIVNKTISFSEAAEEYSECPDCSTENGDCGTWEEDDSDIAPELLKTCLSIPTNTLSKVIDTEEAYHLVIVTSRYTPTAKAREEDGEVASADVKHIQLDKWTLDPEYTPDTARKQLEGRFLARVLRAKQKELIAKVPIKSVIPLKEGGKGSRGTTYRFKAGERLPTNKNNGK